MTAARTRLISGIVVCALLVPALGRAVVTKVTIASRAPVGHADRGGDGLGAYEKLTGTIEFSLDPSDRHNARIVDLSHASRGSDGRVHFSADLYVLQPADPSRGNGTLLFEIANRGRKGVL